MEIIIHVILVLIPAAAVIVMAYLMLKKFTEKEDRQTFRALKIERQKHFLPLRVDAYQRMVLFLERISPNSLIMRAHQQETTAFIFQKKLLQAVREEYDHNVAQQIFMSPEAWSLVVNGKEQLVQLINTAADSLKDKPDATSLDLSQRIFEIASEQQLGLDVAKDFIKKELQKLF